MAVAPFIKPIQTKQGILYTFQSSIEDINMTFSNGSNKTKFSKFALLRLPEIGTPNTLATDNKIQFMAQGETPLIDGLNNDHNINLAQSFQNYALNLETMLTSMSTYERDLKSNVSERVFWKWLKELGAIRWRESSLLEKDTNLSSKRFTEEDETNSTYKRVVKYIGDIDVVNSVRNNNNSYSELYIHVPSNVGSSPYVLFDSQKDANYYPGMVINNAPPDPLDEEYLAGRHYTDEHPYELSIKGFFDLDDNSVTNEISNSISIGTLMGGNWFNGTINNSYYTDSTLINGDPEFNVPTNQLIRKTKSATQITYVRNTLDGVKIDFDLASYKLATQNPAIKSLAHLNDYVANQNFEFNAVLVYYDVYDPNSMDGNGNYTDSSTNLYGILFLDKVEQSGLEFMIPTMQKNKPDPIAKINGNSFAYKLNVKFDNSIEDSTVERSINDYNTFSLDLYLDVLTEFKKITSAMNDKIVELETTKQLLEKALDALVNSDNLNTLAKKIDVIETSIEENNALFANSDGMLKMIDKVNKKVDDLYAGNTSISVAYNTDAIRTLEGLKSEKYSNRIWIRNINQEYNISNDSIFNLSDVVNGTLTSLKLGTFTNYFRHENETLPIVLLDDLELRLDDTIKWQKGQVVEIVFDDAVDLGSYEVKVTTDAKNLLGASAEYSKQITLWTSTEFGTGRNPIFRIICINPTTFEFRVDKIR